MSDRVIVFGSKHGDQVYQLVGLVEEGTVLLCDASHAGMAELYPDALCALCEKTPQREGANAIVTVSESDIYRSGTDVQNYWLVTPDLTGRLVLVRNTENQYSVRGTVIRNLERSNGKDRACVIRLLTKMSASQLDEMDIVLSNWERNEFDYHGNGFESHLELMVSALPATVRQSLQEFRKAYFALLRGYVLRTFEGLERGIVSGVKTREGSTGLELCSVFTYKNHYLPAVLQRDLDMHPDPMYFLKFDGRAHHVPDKGDVIYGSVMTNRPPHESGRKTLEWIWASPGLDAFVQFFLKHEVMPKDINAKRLVESMKHSTFADIMTAYFYPCGPEAKASSTVQCIIRTHLWEYQVPE